MILQLLWVDRALLSFGFGMLLGLSTPGFDYAWLAWCGLAPLMVLLRGVQSKKEAVLVGLAFGMGYHLVGLSWLLKLYPLTWMGLDQDSSFRIALGTWVVESFHQALLFAGFAFFLVALPMRAGWLPYHIRPYFPYLLSVPLLWIFFQWMIGTSTQFSSFPLHQLAYSQSKQLELIQMTMLGGSQLLEFVLVLANTILASAIIEISGWVPRLEERVEHFSGKEGVLLDSSVIIVLLLVAYFWGGAQVNKIAACTSLYRDGVPAAQYSLPVPVGVVQGNVGMEEKEVMSQDELKDRYLTMARKAGVAFLVLPERVIDAQQLKSGIGALKSRVVAPAASSLGNPRRALGQGDAASFMSDGFLPIWFAGRLICFSSSPWSLPDVLPEFDTGGTKMGIATGMEVIYPALISAKVRKGAALLVGILNLSRFHDSLLGNQILAAAVMRAVENRRYFILATTTGISAVIDPGGVVTASSFKGTGGSLVSTVQFLNEKTPLARMWWL